MGSGVDGEIAWIIYDSGLRVFFCLLIFLLVESLGLEEGMDYVDLCLPVLLWIHCFLSRGGGRGMEKELGRVYNTGGIFFLTEFFVNEVIGFQSSGRICSFGFFPFFVKLFILYWKVKLEEGR